ncbi:MAG: hypothetical protein J6A01_03600 [Proteobacteria bacterium]|nr:hypothetical protein [Pseudomonadota bacterium]
MSIWSNILYNYGQYNVATELSQCLEAQSNADEKQADTVKIEVLRKQLQNITLTELKRRNPDHAKQMMCLKDAVTDEIIDDVWTNPYSKLVQSLDELCQMLVQMDHTLDDDIHKQWGIWETLIMMSHCNAFLTASVADKAFMLVSQWGCISFDQFRMILQVFFGLNDIQILAILVGSKARGGLLRICRIHEEPFDMIEPVYCSAHKDYASRSSHDELLMLFYPYLTDDCWEQQHPLYQAFLSCTENKEKEHISHAAMLARLITIVDAENINQENEDPHLFMIKRIMIERLFSDPEQLSERIQMIVQKASQDELPNRPPDELAHAIMNSIASSGVPIRLEDLFACGKDLGATDSEVMQILLHHLYELVICHEGESVRIRRVSEYLSGLQIDPSYQDEPDDQIDREESLEQPPEQRFQKVMDEFYEKYNDHPFNNLSEKVHTLLTIWDDEIRLKDLETICMSLGFTESRKSISRVLKDYPDKFYSCENISKRGFWCCRETAIRLGYPDC